MVEDIIRTTKSILETWPIYHKRDETSRGHVFCFVALLLKQELESRMKQAALESEWKAVIRGLDALQQVEANFQGRRFFIPWSAHRRRFPSVSVLLTPSGERQKVGGRDLSSLERW